jgi:hypothetical protein
VGASCASRHTRPGRLRAATCPWGDDHLGHVVLLDGPLLDAVVLDAVDAIRGQEQGPEPWRARSASHPREADLIIYPDHPNIPFVPGVPPLSRLRCQPQLITSDRNLNASREGLE